jgi:predicted RNA-binding protein
MMMFDGAMCMEVLIEIEVVGNGLKIMDLEGKKERRRIEKRE